MKIGIINSVVSAISASGAAVALILGADAPIPIALSALATAGSIAAVAACAIASRNNPRGQRGNRPAEAPTEAPADSLAPEPPAAPAAPVAPADTDADALGAAEEAETRLTMARLELRYADSILSKVPVETEAAAFALMERIITIRDQSDKARKSAIASSGDTATDTSIAELTENARATIAGVRSALADMRKHDRTATAELQALGKEIAAGMAQLAEISEITERSRLIAFNMAIEAARIGSKGNGFKVIVNELRDLNDQTAVFSKRVSGLLGRFKEFTDSLIKKSSTDSSSLAEEVERGIQNEERAIESLMTISHACIDMSGDIEQVVASVNKDLDGILESLQFQDITRQIVEGAQAVLNDVRNELDSLPRPAGIERESKPDPALTRELRSRLIASAHTRAEKEAIQEVII